MVALLQATNLGLRFLLELAALAALGWWGWRHGPNVPLKVVLAAGAPLVAAVVWGLFAAPKAAIPVPGVAQVAVQVAVFAAATLALLANGAPRLAVAFAVVAIANAALMALWGQ